MPVTDGDGPEGLNVQPAHEVHRSKLLVEEDLRSAQIQHYYTRLYIIYH